MKKLLLPIIGALLLSSLLLTGCSPKSGCGATKGMAGYR